MQRAGDAYAQTRGVPPVRKCISRGSAGDTQQESAWSYLQAGALFLIAALTLFTLCRRLQSQQAWHAALGTCSHLCRGVAPDGDETCALECQAPSCYEQVYAAEPLEPGEVDHARAIEFARCLRSLEPGLKRSGLWPPKVDLAKRALKEA